MQNVAALILAAGKGTRMKSSLPKVLHKVGGKAMVEKVLETVKAVPTDRQVLVTGFGGEAVRNYLGDAAEFVEQKEQLGTGHAVREAQALLETYEGTVLVLCGDTPLVRTSSLQDFLNYHCESGNSASVLTAHMDDPTGYGRIIRDDNQHVCRIVEQKDGSPEELAVSEINTGIYAFGGDLLWPALAQISADNAQGELYLTDVIGILVNEGKVVGAYQVSDSSEILGVNSRVQLAEAEAILRERKNIELMDAGVTIIDPATTYIEESVQVGQDTIIYPGTILAGKTVIGENCRLGPQVRLVDVEMGNDAWIHFSYAHECTIKDGVDVGPYVHIRPNTVLGKGVHVGNFVEIKNSVVGEGTKFPHLSYIGDSDIGSKVNIGCGTITVNYNGKTKNRTVVKDGAFVGCNSNLVAPVVIGERSYIGAGSTITKNVPDKALAVGRSKQIVKESWVNDDTFKK